jgi:hypothetical protein
MILTHMPLPCLQQPPSSPACTNQVMWSPITPPKINNALTPHSNGKRGRDLSIFIVVFHVMPIVGKGYGEAYLSRSGFTCLVISKNDKIYNKRQKSGKVIIASIKSNHHLQNSRTCNRCNNHVSQISSFQNQNSHVKLLISLYL